MLPPLAPLRPIALNSLCVIVGSTFWSSILVLRRRRRSTDRGRALDDGGQSHGSGEVRVMRWVVVRGTVVMTLEVVHWLLFE